MIAVIGLDGATWKVIEPNIELLPNLKSLCSVGVKGTIHVEGTVMSPAIWCSMFSGLTTEQHCHTNFFVRNDDNDITLLKREDIKVEFVWDTLKKQGHDVVVMNVPIVVPTYTIGSTYRYVGAGLPINPDEWDAELERLTDVTCTILDGHSRPDVLIAVYTVLDRVQHLHWGGPEVVYWYQQVDLKLGDIIKRLHCTDSLIVVSDHGFCSWDEAEEHTLRHTEDIKGDHHPDAIVISLNVGRAIERTVDVYHAIIDNAKGGTNGRTHD